MKNTISFLRRSKRISQLALARMIGVSPSYLCKIEKSVQEPSEEFIKKCCSILDVQRDEIFPKRTVARIEKTTYYKTNPVWLARQRSGMKQCELAEMIECSPSYLCKVENNRLEPTDFFKKRCAKILKRKESELFPE